MTSIITGKGKFKKVARQLARLAADTPKLTIGDLARTAEINREIQIERTREEREEREEIKMRGN